MAISNRQQQLFAAEDWTVAYKAYTNVDFQAYDFDTIRAALVDYVRINFPENFNDYIESSEFIAIIELLAYLSQSLAFRMDVNTRENFLETAERRDSVFKLARMLGYTPKRNTCASGLLKITAIRTSEPIKDSRGIDLNGKTIYWNDANNPQSYEQFITILNSAMSSTNRFTSPVKSGMVADIMTELYQINTASTAPVTYGFNINVNGQSKSFNVVNPDFTDNESFYERHPDPANLFNFIYRNDGKGLASRDTGFFVMFKQGSLAFSDYNYTVPVQSRTQELSVANINDTDVFLQEINLAGQVLNKWEQVSNSIGQTINFNSILKNTKNLYAVETVGNTGIRIKYPDGNFGNVPVGIYRAWYRVSDPTEYSIMPEDARNINVSIPYTANNGREYILTITAALQNKVENSSGPETLADIKTYAPEVYYTQNRMVSAQDYNVFPTSQSTNIKKIKAINRTHAGHSRYIDINDPTGSFHNVDVYAKDAYLYVEDKSTAELITVNTNTTPLDVVTSIIPGYLKSQRLNNFVYHAMRQAYLDNNINTFRVDVIAGVSPTNIKWKTLPINTSGKTGYVTEQYSSGTSVENILVTNTVNHRVFRENNFVKWVNPVNSEEYKWTRIINIDNNGLLGTGYSTGIGSWTLSEEVTHDWIATEVIVSLRKLFNTSEANDVIDEIENRRTFALRYDAKLDAWAVIPSSEIDRNNPFGVTQNLSNLQDPRWLLLFDYSPVSGDINSYRYNVTVRGEEYVIQSKNDLRFYNVKAVKVLDSDNKSSRDLITFTTVNSKPSTRETYEWQVNSSTGFWKNMDIATSMYLPAAYSTGIPLKTRNTKWFEVAVSWQSRFGLIPDGDLMGTSFVPNDAVIPLNTYYQSVLADGNIIINNNSGQITKFPASVVIPFDGTLPFGANVLDINGNITYKQFTISGALEYFHGGSTTYSYGTAGNTLDLTTQGRLRVLDANIANQRGNLIYTGLEQNNFFRAADGNGTYADKVLVDYLIEKEALELPIDWAISDVYSYPDGYTDSRKVAVAPLDTDNDLVPDRPLQFNEYVGSDDLVFFEYYTDFDGYTYDRPVSDLILDYRFESEYVYDPSVRTISPATHYDPVPVVNIGWLIVNDTLLEYFNAQILVNDFIGIVLYNVDTGIPYLITQNSTDETVSIIATSDYFVRSGRGQSQNTGEATEDSVIRWRHAAPNDIRIDPSISNVVEMVVLTNNYYDLVTRYVAYPRGDFPAEPTSAELSIEFAGLNEFKNASDSLVYRSAKFKRLFGTDANQEYRAKFRVVKLSNQYSDNELKTRVLRAINEYFDVDNWEFGETFYFTELSTYIHQQLGSAIGSIVIVPKNTSGTFGQLFQVKAEPNELFLNTATVQDIELISKIDSQTLRADR